MIEGVQMSSSLPTTLEAAPYLDVANPSFSMRSKEVLDAREKAGSHAHPMASPFFVTTKSTH
jgi:hypothetical protein